jgi:hypothetical protein
VVQPVFSSVNHCSIQGSAHSGTRVRFHCVCFKFFCIGFSALIEVTHCSNREFTMSMWEYFRHEEVDNHTFRCSLDGRGSLIPNKKDGAVIPQSKRSFNFLVTRSISNFYTTWRLVITSTSSHASKCIVCLWLLSFAIC